jgi:hypothetical protein
MPPKPAGKGKAKSDEGSSGDKLKPAQSIKVQWLRAPGFAAGLRWRFFFGRAN